MKIGFIGGGKMGGAIIEGLRNNGFNGEIAVYELNQERCNFLAAQFKVTPVDSVKGVFSDGGMVFLAVKPQVFPVIEGEVAEAMALNHNCVLISIMAGVTLGQIGAKLPSDAKIIRTMPNLAMSIGAGVCLFTPNHNVTEAEQQAATALFENLGIVCPMAEKNMDGAMAISGCGPAFFYEMIEGLILGGIQVGLSADLSKKLAVATMKGTALLMENSKAHPGVLRDAVLSPGGTTVAGVAVLEAGGFRSDLMGAVKAAAERSKDLAQGGDK